MTPTRDDAWKLFCEWTESDSLRKHVLGVEAAMRAYAPMHPSPPKTSLRSDWDSVHSQKSFQAPSLVGILRTT